MIDINNITDRPMVFGRVKHLWSPACYQVEPLGKMILKKDGSVHEYKNQNESTWKKSLNGFSFLNDWKNPRITSSWHYQDENKILFGKQNGVGRGDCLCLIPDQPVSPDKKIKVIIASYYGFYKKTIPRLITQLLEAGFQKNEIKIVVNESPSRYYDSSYFQGVECLFTTHAFYEFSTYYEAHNFDFDMALVVADTATFTPDCKNRLYDLNGAENWDGWPGNAQGMFGFGVITHDFAKRLHPLMEPLDGLDKIENIHFEAMGGVWQYANRLFTAPSGTTYYEDGMKLDCAERVTYTCESLGVSRHINWNSAFRGDHRVL